MSNIPTIFNRSDFLGKLLPGYVAVILSLVLFYPQLLYIPNQKNQNTQQLLPFDIFSAVVFIIAGPTVGYMLQTFHRNLYTIRVWLSRRNAVKKQQRKEEIEKYARLIALCTNDEKERLQEAESAYDFSISTGIVFALIGISYSIYKGIFELITIPMFILSFILFLGGVIDRDDTYFPLHDELYNKYKNNKNNLS